MTRFQQWMGALEQTNDREQALRTALNERSRDARIVAGPGWGTADRLMVEGRVVRDEGVAGDDAVATLIDVLQGRADVPVSGVTVRATCGERTVEGKTDSHGAFRLEIAGEGFDKRGWHALVVSLPDQGVETTVKVQVPRRDARFGIASTLEDVAMHLSPGDVLQTVRRLVLDREPVRTPFPGVGHLLESLRRDVMAQPRNPLFYVSAESAGVEDLVEGYLAAQAIPVGPMVFRASRADALREVLTANPDLDFVLVGELDDDAAIFLQMVEEFPGQIQAVYLRERADGVLDMQVRKTTRALLDRNVEVILAPDVVPCAEHAAKMGWIRERDLPGIRSARNEDNDRARRLVALRGAA